MKSENLELYKQIILKMPDNEHFDLSYLEDYYDMGVLPDPNAVDTIELNDEDFFNRLSFKHLSKADQSYYQDKIGEIFLDILKKVKGLYVTQSHLSLKEIFELTPEEIKIINNEHAHQSAESSSEIRYEYNPHAQVKIWLSGTPSQFMPEYNRARLKKASEDNPDLKLHLVYDSQLLNDKEKLRIRDFCYQNHIQPFDIRQVIQNQDKYQLTEEERKLINLYEEEINNLGNGGNLAAASDLLRWVSPVYELGTYCDLDVSIHTTLLPDKVDVSSPLLLNIGLNFNATDVYCDNAIIAVIDKEDAQNDIVYIQKLIIKYCTGEVRDPGILGFYHPWESAVSLRQNIINSTKDNVSFQNLLNQHRQEMLEFMERDASNVSNLSIDDITAMRLKFREKLLFEAVMHTTGPLIIGQFLSDKGEHNMQKIIQYSNMASFCGYKTLKKAYKYNPCSSDLSWFEDAQKEIKHANAATTIQYAYSKFKENRHNVPSSSSSMEKSDKKARNLRF